jgi:hypothetical protein
MSNPTAPPSRTPAKKSAVKKVARPRVTATKRVVARKQSPPSQPPAPAATPAAAVAPVAQPSPSPTSAEISARSTKHAAWVAAGAAILAAVLALGGTWWSAKTASDAAVEAVSVQLSGETEKSRAEFLREQRRVLYSTIIAHEIELREAEEQRLNDIPDPADPQFRRRSQRDRIKFASEAMVPVREKLAKLEQDRPSAEIIASPTVREHLKKLYVTHVRIVHSIARMSVLGALDPEYDKLSRYDEDRAEAFDAFAEAARKDMGAE